MVRRTFSGEFKEQIVLEALEAGNQSLVARRHSLSISLLRKWMRLYQEGRTLTPTKPNAVPGVVTARESRQMAAESGALRSENERLKKLLGEKDLEVAMLRDLLKKAHPHMRTGLQ